MLGHVLVSGAAACGAGHATTKLPTVDRMHVFFLAGQSNAEAFKGTDSPGGYPDATVPLIVRIGPPAPPDAWFYTSGDTPISLGPAGGFHSIELAAVTAMKNAGLQMAAIKVSLNGTHLGFFAKGDSSGYYQDFLDTLTLAKSLWGSDIILHFIWLQSEEDATGVTPNTTYEGLLRQFVADTKADFGWTDFWQCKLQPGLAKNVPNGAIVVAAQIQVMSERADTHLLNFDDINVDPPGPTHFLPPELAAMGAQTAAEILATL